MVYYAGNLRFHLAALQDERRKIQVFRRELPLCYEVVTQTIEAWKQKLFEKDAVMECDLALSEDQNSLDRPVFEEFTPLGGDDDQEERKGVHWHQKSDDNREEKKKSEWLRSLQLWNPIPDLNSQEGEYDDDDDSPPVIPEKTPCSEANAIDTNATWSLHWEPRRGNHKDSGKLSSSPADSFTSGNGEGRMTSKGEEKQQVRNSQRKQRRCWWPELHRRFLSALQDLGGPQVATPKQIKELMKVDGLTNDEIKSHLQKYRLHTRRSPPPQNDSPIQAQRLVVVGGIWVPQPDFPVVAGSVSLPQPNKICAPVGTIPMKHSADVEPKTAPAASSSSRTITDP